MLFKHFGVIPPHHIVAGALLALMPLSKASAERALRCDTCTPQAAREAARVNGPGVIYVYSASSGTVRGYEVERESGLLTAFSHPVPSGVQAAVAALGEIYQKTGGTMQDLLEVDATAINIPNAGTVDAVDFLNDVVLRTQIMDSLARGEYSGPGMTVATRGLLQWALNYIGLGDGTSFLITVRFANGTRLDVRVVPGQRQGEYIANSARTANDQIIPEVNFSGNVGTWYGTASELDPLFDQLIRLGVPVTGAAWREEQMTITCTFRDNTLNCVIS